MRPSAHRLQFLPIAIAQNVSRSPGPMAPGSSNRTFAPSTSTWSSPYQNRLQLLPIRIKEELYGILFRATAQTLLTIAADPKHLGAEIGFFAVLHTWGPNLLHHPHLHCVVPGGGLSSGWQHWISCRDGFFLSVRVLSRLFRRLFLEYLSTPSMPANWSFSPRWNHSGTGFPGYLAPAARGRMGRLRQTAFRWTRAGVGLRRALYSSRRDLQ